MSNISPLARLLYRHFASGGWDGVARAVERMIAEAKRQPETAQSAERENANG